MIFGNKASNIARFTRKSLPVLPNSGLKLDVYLINMANAHQRLAAMTSRMRAIGLEAERFEAVDGRRLDFPIPEFSPLSYAILHGRRTCPAEVGCYLSHVECARKLLAGDADAALILEDDVLFDPDFVEAIDGAATQSDSWDILRLTTVNAGRKFAFRQITPTRKLAISLTREKGAGAYIINRRAAEWILTDLMPMRLAYDIAFDLEYISNLKSAFVYPICATQDAEIISQIQEDILSYRLPLWRYLTVLPYRTYLEVTRFVFRSIRLFSELVFNRAKSKSSPVLICKIKDKNAADQAGLVSPGVNPTR